MKAGNGGKRYVSNAEPDFRLSYFRHREVSTLETHTQSLRIVYRTVPSTKSYLEICYSLMITCSFQAPFSCSNNCTACFAILVGLRYLFSGATIPPTLIRPK